MISDTVLVAIISSSSAVLVSITALLLNYKLYDSLQKRIDSLEHRIEMIEKDLTKFFVMLAEQDGRISRLEDKR